MPFCAANAMASGRMPMRAALRGADRTCSELVTPHARTRPSHAPTALRATPPRAQPRAAARQVKRTATSLSCGSIGTTFRTLCRTGALEKASAHCSARTCDKDAAQHVAQPSRPAKHLQTMQPSPASRRASACASPAFEGGGGARSTQKDPYTLRRSPLSRRTEDVTAV